MKIIFILFEHDSQKRKVERFLHGKITISDFVFEHIRMNDDQQINFLNLEKADSYQIYSFQIYLMDCNFLL